jgi:hypothetical protein
VSLERRLGNLEQRAGIQGETHIVIAHQREGGRYEVNGELLTQGQLDAHCARLGAGLVIRILVVERVGAGGEKR